MTEFHGNKEEPGQQKHGETEFEMNRAMRNVDYLGGASLESIDDTPPPAYVREPLFSRKVIIGWATATLVAWFAISFIAPVILESIKTAVKSSMVDGHAQKVRVVTPTGIINIDIPQPPTPPTPPTPPATAAPPATTTAPAPATTPAPEAAAKR